MPWAPIRPLLLKESEIVRVAPTLREIVGIVEAAYRAEAEGRADVPAKIAAHPGRPNSFLHAMPGWLAEPPALGLKAVSYYPGIAARGFRDSTAIILLYDPETGQPIAIMEGMWITFARSVACAAVAAKHLANPAPRRLGLVGCGGLGEWSLRAMTDVFPSISEIVVSSLRPESREAFCRRLANAGPWTLRPAAETRHAVEGMDIVVSSTPQQPEARLKEAWWSPGTLVIPFDYPFAWDDDAYRQCDLLVSDGLGTLAKHEERSRSAGIRPGFRLPANRRSLQELVAGRAGGRQGPRDRIFAIVTGIASTDLAVAIETYRRARREHLGTEFSFT
jgi:ornithine cyclodeaminase/alanine dehydrogenase-like protein (mu-crystallin family)